MVALVFGVAGGDIVEGIDGESIGGGRDALIEVGLAFVVDLVPEGNGDAEVALAAETPILVQAFDPIEVAGTHELGVPLNLPTLFEECFFLVEEVRIPLGRGDKFEGAIAFFEKADGVTDFLRGRGDDAIGVFGKFDDEFAGLVDVGTL